MDAIVFWVTAVGAAAGFVCAIHPDAEGMDRLYGALFFVVFALIYALHHK